MKKINKLLCFLFILFGVIVFSPNNINAASVSVSGPKTVRPGDSITVTIKANASKMEGIQLNVSYSSDTLSYSSASKKMPNPWQTSIEKSSGKINIVSIDYDMTKPLNSATVCTLKFKVKGAKGDKFSVSVSGKVSDASGQTQKISSSSYSKTISAPLSSNANLSSLAVSNANISPKFNPNTTTYKASVKYATSSLSINAKPADSSAKIKIKNNSLKAGKVTSVNVVVTAPDGTQKTYSISTKREQDPNYVASKENSLENIKLDKGILSPVFDKNKTDYIIYLPYEVTVIKISATSVDKNASIKIYGPEELTVGENSMGVICTSESGEDKEYKIKVVRAPSYENEEDEGADIESVLSQFESITQQDDKKHKNVILDLSSSHSQKIPKEVFEKLKKLDNTSLTILLGNGRVIFESKDITEKINNDYYDFSLSFYSEYEALIKEKANDKNATVYKIGEETTLPGYATFILNTSYIENENINVYKYDLENDKFYLISENSKIKDGGVLIYKNNTCSEYLLTGKTISSAKRSEACDMQSNEKNGKYLFSILGISFDLFDIIYISITFVLSFIFGILIGKSRGKKKNVSYEFNDSRLDMRKANQSKKKRRNENIRQNNTLIDNKKRRNLVKFSEEEKTK